MAITVNNYTTARRIFYTLEINQSQQITAEVRAAFAVVKSRHQLKTGRRFFKSKTINGKIWITRIL